MPATTIEVRRSYTHAEELALIEAVHAALVEAFRIPVGDRSVRLVVHEPHRFTCSPKVTDPERFTLITIACFTGRSLDAKRALYSALVRNLDALGITAQCVKVVLQEIPRENWGLRGQAACDIDLGFKVDV